MSSDRQSGSSAARTPAAGMLALALVATPACGNDRRTEGAAPPEAPYEVVEGWPALPEGVKIGEAAGVAVDSHDHVFVFHRASADFTNGEVIPEPTVLCIDGVTGALVSQWGERRFVVPHGLSIDADDNLWLTDVGLDRIFKFSHDGELLLEMGRD